MTMISSQAGSAPVQLNVNDSGGDGRPVVLIHGWPLSAESWSAQVPALTNAGYRVVSYDRRGFGASDQPDDGYDYDTMAGDLDAVMITLGLDGAVVVGFSMGGGEVARYIGRLGTSKLSGAVFASAVPPYLLKTDDNPDGGLADGDMAAPGSTKAALDCIDAFARTDFRDDLAKVDVPTLVLHGDGDGIVPIDVSGERTQAAVAGAQFVVIEGGPHGINVSHTDEFNSALIDFLGSLS